ncbi:hypothetical protein [Streptomyces sp. NPDC003996]
MIGVCVQGLLADRYELQELLGRGAMGEVWRACDHLLGRPVAVKLLHAEEAADAERFRLEAQIAARLNHASGPMTGPSRLVTDAVNECSTACGVTP